MKKTILVFSALVLAILLLFQMSKYAVISGDMNSKIVIGVIAVVFFFIGTYINRRSSKSNGTVARSIDHEKIKQLEISKREYEVLVAVASGLSNKEIADKLFLSESTIKTHVSNILVKLNAKRRTQAIQIAKSENLI